MNHYKIAVIPGDGIGPEVIREGLKVLDATAAKHNFKLEYTHFPFGGEHYLKTGEVLPDTAIMEFKNYHAIFLGGIGHPDVKPGILEKGILLKLRFDLDLYINLRPVKLYDNVTTPIKNVESGDIDYLVFRENTGGLYTGVGEFQKKETSEEVAIQSMIYSHKQVERCVRFAFETLLKKHQNNPWKGLSADEIKKGYIGKLTLCGKTNVLTYVYDLWDRVFNKVAAEFPQIMTDYVHVDAMCIYMIENPQRFDGIVTGNMFGDIITDLAAVTQGGMGVAPSGNINPNSVSMFEPVHGTAPAFAGKGVINPIATILTAQMMLNHLGECQAAEKIEIATKKTLQQMKSMLVGKMGYSTAEVGDLIVKHL
ncbi:MAG: 3-isopropylmalate dehydrogenase [Candidatus Omnitrophica bacterium]|nr:3-isopropylmalate dehydrogenase [Candidatus Omnitrophota bacterium]